MSRTKKNSILIVDDESVNIISLSHILSNKYTIFSTRSGQEAVYIAKEHSPDVILLDVLMPDMDGFETFAALKTLENIKNIPIIFITGLNDTNSEKKGLELGAFDYITKPFNSDVVLLRVQNQLKILNHTRAIDEQLKQQALMTKIAHSFLTGANAHSLFTETLRLVGEFMDIAQILLFKLENDRNMVCISEWKKPQIKIEKNIGMNLNLNEKLISFIHSLYADREGDLCFHSNDPVFKDLSLPFRKNFFNYITTPIFIKGEMCAVLDFSKDENTEEWSQSEINLAVLVSSIFSSVLERDAMDSDLTEIKKLEAGLIAAKEEAEYSSRAKSEFLSRMSHEMRTPMNAIIGMIQIIKMQNIPDNMKEYFDEMDISSRQLLHLIDDALDLSSMEYGMFKLKKSILNINAMFNDILQTAKYNASVKQQTLNVNLNPAIPEMLSGDEKHLKQVIQTLLANAVKYAPEHGEIFFSAGVPFEDSEKITLQIEVKDNGIGISKEQQEKLFTIFEQVNGGMNRKYGGIGIGLALSKRIAEMMDGNIWVESELNKGAKFYFTCMLQKLK